MLFHNRYYIWILFKVNVDIDLTAVLLKNMFCILLIIIAFFALFTSECNLNTSILIQLTGVDDNYNKPRIQCVCLLGTLGTSDTNDIENCCGESAESHGIFDCIVVNSDTLLVIAQNSGIIHRKPPANSSSSCVNFIRGNDESSDNHDVIEVGHIVDTTIYLFTMKFGVVCQLLLNCFEVLF